MAVRVGINGFGRIGKVVFRILENYPLIEVVVINDLMDISTLEHLLKYDSTHRRFKGTVTKGEGCINVNGKEVKVTAFSDPVEIPWKEMKVDYVLESSGLFTKRSLLEKHLHAGAQKVVLSCPPKDKLDRTVVIGVNDHDLKKEDRIISNASCTTNCLAPVLKLLDDNYGVDRAFMNTVHPFTNNQTIIDAPHKDLRRARTAGVNIIPTTSTAVETLIMVMPEMINRFDGLAVRVPVHDGSLIELSAILKKNVTKEEVNILMKRASENGMCNILSYTDDPIVSSDIIGDPHSGIFDAMSTRVLGGNFVQTITWYDNESGYSHRIVDLLIKMARLDGKI
jgi:glyceraldehyde 3-phosphate dehydrogenase